MWRCLIQSWLLYIFFFSRNWNGSIRRAEPCFYICRFLFILTEIRGESSDCIIIHAMRLLLPLSASSHQLRSVELQKAAKCRVGHLWNLCFSFLLFSEKLFCWLIVHNVALITVVLPAWLLSIVSVWTLRISCLGHFDVSDATFKLSYLMWKKTTPSPEGGAFFNFSFSSIISDVFQWSGATPVNTYT